jgi:hypothetical protein
MASGVHLLFENELGQFSGAAVSTLSRHMRNGQKSSANCATTTNTSHHLLHGLIITCLWGGEHNPNMEVTAPGSWEERTGLDAKRSQLKNQAILSIPNQEIFTLPIRVERK